MVLGSAEARSGAQGKRASLLHCRGCTHAWTFHHPVRFLRSRKTSETYSSVITQKAIRGLIGHESFGAFSAWLYRLLLKAPALRRENTGPAGL
jgi:hypothetical protein